MRTVELDYSDVLIVPMGFGKISSRSQVDLENKDAVIPIIAANMDHVGTFEVAKALAFHNILTCLTKHYTAGEYIDFFKSGYLANHSIYSFGLGRADDEKLVQVIDSIKTGECYAPHMFCLDVANAYNVDVLNKVKEFHQKYPEFKLMVGNVVSRVETQSFLNAGASVVKVGVGPGSACLTRSETGIGRPQLSAVMDCHDATKNLFNERIGSICADGGITCPGDVVKAFAAGADYVMLGGEFAGHDEGYTEEELANDKLQFYGMSSHLAQVAHGGEVKEYRSSEGRELFIKRKGPIKNTVNRYLAGLRSACAYLDCENINELKGCVGRNANFIRVNNQLNRKFV